jgi:hypothetical protein
LAGSPGVILRVSWDGEPRDIDFNETGGFAQIQRSFAAPWWGFLAVGLLVWGSILYAAVTIVLSSQLAWPGATLPAWAACALLAGLVLSLAVLVLDVPPGYLELPLVLSLVTLLVAPASAVSKWLQQLAPAWKLGTAAARAIRRHSTLLVAVVSLCLAIGIFGRSIWTDWFPFDDHDLMLFVGPERTLSISRFLGLLPEIGSGALGIPTRFRPSYWFLRLVECLVWGAQPYGWHAFRVIILGMALFLFWRMAASTLGWLGAGMLCAYVLTYPYWGEIVGWLGPGETYALAGLPIYIWGMARLLHGVKGAGKGQLQAGCAVLLGSVICMGAKENFVLLVLPSAYLAYRAYSRREAVSLSFALASIAFAAYVSGGIVTAMLRSGTDVYLHSISPSQRAARLLAAVQSPPNLVPLLSLATLTVLPGTILLCKELTREARRAVLRSQFWMAVLALVYLSQLVFYNGTWPTGTRYDFPGLLYLPASVFVMFRLGMLLTPPASRRAATQAARSALALAMALLVTARGYGPTVGFLERNVSMTHEFVSGLEHIVGVLREHEDHALVIESGSSMDYEMIFSYERFLRAYGVKNALFLRLHGYSLDTATYTLESALSANLVEVSDNGSTSYDPLSRLNQLPAKEYPGFSALDGLEQFGDRCYSLDLSGNSLTECEIVN